jgi:hypothetical protein
MGLVFVPVTLIATSGIPNEDAGLASGMFNTSQQVGGALGLAVLSTFAASTTSDRLAGIGQPSRDDRLNALVDGFHVAYLSGAVVLAVAGVLLLLLLRRRDVAAVSEGEPVTAVA